MRITDSGWNYIPTAEIDTDFENRKNLKELALDIMKHSFANLVSTLFTEINKNNEYVEVDDVYIYIKLSAFFMCLFRHFSYEKLAEDKKINPNSTLNLHLHQIGPSL